MLLTLIPHINQNNTPNNNHINFGAYNKELYAALRKIEAGAVKAAGDCDYCSFEKIIGDFAENRQSKDYKEIGYQGSKAMGAILTGMIDMLGQKLTAPVEHVLTVFVEKLAGYKVDSQKSSYGLITQLSEKYRSLNGSNNRILTALDSMISFPNIEKILIDAIKTSDTSKVEHFLNEISKRKQETGKIQNRTIDQIAKHLSANISEENLSGCERILNIFLDSMPDYHPTEKSKTHQYLQELFDKYKTTGSNSKEIFQKFENLLSPHEFRKADKILEKAIQSGDLSEFETYISGMIREKKGHSTVHPHTLKRVFEALTKYLDSKTLESLEPAIKLTLDHLHNITLTSKGESGKILFNLQKKYQEVGGKDSSIIGHMDQMIFGSGQKTPYRRVEKSIEYLFENGDFKTILDEFMKFTETYQKASTNPNTRYAYYHCYASFFDRIYETMNEKNLNDVAQLLFKMLNNTQLQRIRSNQKPFVSIANVLDKFEMLGGKNPIITEKLSSMIFGDGTNGKINKIRFYLERAFKEENIDKFEKELQKLQKIKITNNPKQEGQKAINECRNFVLTCIEDSLEKRNIPFAERLITGFESVLPKYRAIGYRERIKEIAQKYKDLGSPKEHILTTLDKILYSNNFNKRMNEISGILKGITEDTPIEEFEDALKQFAELRSQHNISSKMPDRFRECLGSIFSYIDKKAESADIEETERLILLFNDYMPKFVIFKGLGHFNQLESIKQKYLAAGGKNSKVIDFFNNVVRGEKIKIFKSNIEKALISSDFTDLEETLPKLITKRSKLKKPRTTEDLFIHIKETVTDLIEKYPKKVSPANLGKLILLLTDNITGTININEYRIFDMLTTLYEQYEKIGGVNENISTIISNLFLKRNLNTQLNKIKSAIQVAAQQNNVKAMSEAIQDLVDLRNPPLLTKSNSRNYCLCIDTVLKSLADLINKQPVSDTEPLLEQLFTLTDKYFFKFKSKNYRQLKKIRKLYIKNGGKDNDIIKKFDSRIVNAKNFEFNSKEIKSAIETSDIEKFTDIMSKISQLKLKRNVCDYLQKTLEYIAENINADNLEQTKKQLLCLEKLFDICQDIKIGTTQKALKLIKTKYTEAGGNDKDVLLLLDNELLKIRYKVEELTKKHKGLVDSMVNIYRHKGDVISYNDLEQEAKTGLLMAILNYDGRGAFSTYAWPTIRGYLLNVFKNARTIKIPDYLYSDIKELAIAREQLLYELKRQPTNEELTKRLKWSDDRLKKVLKASAANYSKSLDAPIRREKGGHKTFSLIDRISKTETQPYKKIQDIVLSDEINNALQYLSPRERNMIILKFGLGGGETLTLEEIGKIYKITRERVRQIINNAIKKLQNPNITKNLIGFLD